MNRGPSALVGLVLAVLAFVAGGCAEPEGTVVRYRPFLTGITGAQFAGQGPVNADVGLADARTLAAADQDVVENPDGTRTLRSRSIAHLLRHLARELEGGDDRVIVDQLVSERLVEQFRTDGRPPETIPDFLRSIRPDLLKTFAKMPMGEYSPQVVLHQPGDRTFELEVSGRYAEGLRFTRLWARLEGGNWKFVWVR